LTKNKTEISIDDFENMKARDLEDLINQKAKQIAEKKGLQINKMLSIIRAHTLTMLLCSDLLFVGIVYNQFAKALMITVWAIIAFKIISAVVRIFQARKK